MLSLVNGDRSVTGDRSPAARTPSLHGDDRPGSPDIDVDSPDQDSPRPQLSPKDIKEEEEDGDGEDEDEEEEEEEEGRPSLFQPPPSLFAPLALHLQRPPALPPSFPIFQPFLPLAPILRRTVPFSIEAILRPEFGQRLSPPPSISPPATSLENTPLRRGFSSSPPVSPPTSRSRSPAGRPPTKGKSDLPTSDADCPPGMVRGPNGQLWPAWVFCTRYSDRPSSGPRLRKVKKSSGSGSDSSVCGRVADDKRPRTAFSSEQLSRLKHEFDSNRYLTEDRRRSLSQDLGLNENQIKIWFQNKRAKLKKSTGHKGELAQMLSAQGLYNHSTVSLEDEESALYGM